MAVARWRWSVLVGALLVGLAAVPEVVRWPATAPVAVGQPGLTPVVLPAIPLPTVGTPRPVGPGPYISQDEAFARVKAQAEAAPTCPGGFLRLELLSAELISGEALVARSGSGPLLLPPITGQAPVEAVWWLVLRVTTDRYVTLQIRLVDATTGQPFGGKDVGSEAEAGLAPGSVPPLVPPPTRTPALPAPAVRLEPVGSYQVGRNPRPLAVADLNRDGVPDLVVGLADGPGVAVLLGRGGGRFGNPVEYRGSSAGGSGVFGLAVRDLDGDGAPDLVMAEVSLGTVSVLPGQGDGTFGPAASYPVGMSPNAVAVGDFDGDGRLDLAVSNFLSGSVSVLLGQPDGAFGGAISYPVGQRPDGLLVLDLDGDGLDDLLVTNEITTPEQSGILPLYGRRSGRLSEGKRFAPTARTLGYAFGNFTGQSGQDLAAGAAGGGCFGITVLPGQGGGVFGEPITTAVDRYAGSAVAVDDFDGDGRLDLALAGQGNAVSLWLGQGDGTFRFSAATTAGANLLAVAAGDLDGDGRPDLVLTNPSGNSVEVLLNRGVGPPLPQPTPVPLATPPALASVPPNPYTALPAPPGVPLPAPVPTAILFGMPTPTPNPADPLVARWQDAADHLRSWRGTQQWATLQPDGTIEPGLRLSADGPRLLSVDEAVESGPAEPPGQFRVRLVVHFTDDDWVSVLDAGGGFQYSRATNQVIRPLPPATASGTLWSDGLDAYSLSVRLRPALSYQFGGPGPAVPPGATPVATPYHHPYTLVGYRELDGRQVAELVAHPAGNEVMSQNGREGTRVFLDLATALPYRIVQPAGSPVAPGGVSASGDQVAELTVSIEPNAVLTDADFTVALPPDALTIYIAGYPANLPIPELPRYASIAAAAAAVDYPVYWPRGVPFAQATGGLVEQFGVRYPSIAALLPVYSNSISIMQGRYPPGYTPEVGPPVLFGPPRPSQVITGAITRTVEVAGHPATLVETSRGLLTTITVDFGSTQVRLSGGFDSVEALAWARDLVPVPPDAAAVAATPEGPTAFPTPLGGLKTYYLGSRAVTNPSEVSLMPRRDGRTRISVYPRDAVPPPNPFPPPPQPPRAVALHRGTCDRPLPDGSLPLRDYADYASNTTVDLPIETLTDGTYFVEVQPPAGRPDLLPLCGELAPGNEYVPGRPSVPAQPAGPYSQPPVPVSPSAPAPRPVPTGIIFPTRTPAVTPTPAP